MDQFCSQLRGTNDGQDFPRDMLEKLYNAILANPLTLPEDEAARNKIESQNAGGQKKYELFLKETQDIQKVSEDLMLKQFELINFKWTSF